MLAHQKPPSPFWERVGGEGLGRTELLITFLLGAWPGTKREGALLSFVRQDPSTWPSPKERGTLQNQKARTTFSQRRWFGLFEACRCFRNQPINISSSPYVLLIGLGAGAT